MWRSQCFYVILEVFTVPYSLLRACFLCLFWQGQQTICHSFHSLPEADKMRREVFIRPKLDQPNSLYWKFGTRAQDLELVNCKFEINEVQQIWDWKSHSKKAIFNRAGIADKNFRGSEERKELARRGREEKPWVLERQITHNKLLATKDPPVSGSCSSGGFIPCI